MYLCGLLEIIQNSSSKQVDYIFIMLSFFSWELPDAAQQVSQLVAMDFNLVVPQPAP